MDPSPSIAIIGGGPSGLVFARLLEVNGITDYVVFERDESSTPVPCQQGGTLDLHSTSGQLALKRAGLFEKFSKDLARWDAACLRILNSAGETVANFSEIGDRPEIDRLQLRQLLLESIPPQKIRWGHGVSSIEKSADGENSAHAEECIIRFVNGNSATGFRLIVGADGAWSKVRPLLTSASPVYSGKMYIDSALSQDNPSYSLATELVGKGNTLVLGESKMIAVQQLADASYRVYIGLVVPEDFYPRSHYTDSDANARTEAMRSRLLSSNELFANYALHLKGFIEKAEGPFRPWPLYFMKPETVGWERSAAAGVTLLGDAAHVSTPFAGEGVNCSMYDAVMLADSIIEHCGKSARLARVERSSLETALAAYEKEMFVRGQKLIRESSENGLKLFAEDTTRLLEMFRGDDGKEAAGAGDDRRK
ncbi:Monooxygenase FAD-binding [Penicillium canescens]|uniref:Monooxygenase FAD-binding n=1 Tax=Penicillium canescens TaxID=5083 RepID=A0AAD6IGJ0_PENCN|nr:Monooxygenase FAD-binding [Penicillium canescens]KAJ6029116.1 Monooxygenase FAD-binding [Penicillium canescens]KAJ6047548.1 Monooxygenase FAD-binding [Penicillium canescens]KAJ6048856.1 Monooxygenase FAD-binding [Penicillium canescens]KAJ6100631.1 Monooxygenase FAD-binding [Penicillium canescens]KAJ6173092.1 Monooxygenase FAD-binding [Penicillium canescens]